MKKLFLFFTGAWFAASSVQAVETSGIFSDDTFTVAAAVKIGRNAGVISAPKYSKLDKGGSICTGPSCGGKVNVCTSSSECKDNEKCSNKACVPACDTPCPAGKTCYAESHQCKTQAPCDIASVAAKCTSSGLKCVNDGDTAKCVKCITNSDCGSGGICTRNNLCLRPIKLCRNKICAKGYRCSLGRCLPYPLGSTDDPQCSGTQVADGNGGCKSPCEGVTCPRGKICTASAGKACCGDCTIKAVNAVKLKTLNTKLKLPETTALRWHPQLNVCLPRLEYKFVADDFKVVAKPFPYTGLVRAVELDTNLTDKSVVKLVESSATKVDSSLTLDKAVSLRADPVLLKATTTTDEILTIQKTPAVMESSTLQQLKVAP